LRFALVASFSFSSQMHISFKIRPPLIIGVAFPGRSSINLSTTLHCIALLLLSLNLLIIVFASAPSTFSHRVAQLYNDLACGWDASINMEYVSLKFLLARNGLI
jgi:predicted membrane protein